MGVLWSPSSVLTPRITGDWEGDQTRAILTVLCIAMVTQQTYQRLQNNSGSGHQGNFLEPLYT